MNIYLYFLTFAFLTTNCFADSPPIVKVGAEIFFTKNQLVTLKNKKIGIITNHTAINSHMQSTLDLLRKSAKSNQFIIKAIFAPEHGLKGAAYANEEIVYTDKIDNVPIYLLHGKTSRPTPEMLKDIDILIYDIQDIGSRSYTYCTTLFYAMEEAVKYNIEVIVLDRPNPMNGITIDGPMLDNKLRSKVGYINVPYCHGMTIGELAQFFNGEYKINCKLRVIPMQGWNRQMTFQETGLVWIPTSPQIPESNTVFFYPTTGILGELSLVNIGIGYTLPFKIVGAPWIDPDIFAKHLNTQKFPGVHFEPFHYRPFYGKYAHQDCYGVLIVITDHKIFKPVTTQYLILGIIKSLYPEKFSESIIATKTKRDMFNKVNGTTEIYNIMTSKDYIVWALRSFQEKERQQFSKLRLKYLIPSYTY